MERARPPRGPSEALAAVAAIGVADEDDDSRRMEKSVLTFTAIFTAVTLARRPRALPREPLHPREGRRLPR